MSSLCFVSDLLPKKSENIFLSKINEFVRKERVIQVQSIQIELYLSIKSARESDDLNGRKFSNFIVSTILTAKSIPF